jgi:hypothetical protein
MSPEARAYQEDMARGIYTREGTMVAFPTCFPGETSPIVHDESRITALDCKSDGTIYGGTSGRQTHLFVASFRGLHGIVFDIGSPVGATRCEAVCCGTSVSAAFVNGPRGGRAVGVPRVSIAEDLIQEWGFRRPELQDLGECVPGEAVKHAVAGAKGDIVVGATAGHVFVLDFASSKIRIVGEVPTGGRIAATPGGRMYGRDGDGHLWQYDSSGDTFRRRAVPLPPGAWDKPLIWAKDARSGRLFVANSQAQIFSFDDAKGFTGPVCTAPLVPVGPMAVTLDGRLFGFCGDVIAKMFCYDPKSGEVKNLGVAASVIERRRYGCVFGDAVVGREGEIVFGEDDDGGHLWLYFPRIAVA